MQRVEDCQDCDLFEFLVVGILVLVLVPVPFLDRDLCSQDLIYHGRLKCGIGGERRDVNSGLLL